MERPEVPGIIVLNLVWGDPLLIAGGRRVWVSVQGDYRSYHNNVKFFIDI
jgi:hypothetical protein